MGFHNMRFVFFLLCVLAVVLFGLFPINQLRRVIGEWDDGTYRIQIIDKPAPADDVSPVMSSLESESEQIDQQEEVVTNKPESTPSLHPSEAPTESNRSTYASPDPDSSFYASIARLPDVFQSIEAKPPGKKRRKSNKPSKQTTTDDYPPDHVEHSKLESVSKELNRLLIRVLNLLRPLVAKESERYTPLTTLLNTRVHSDDFITSEETRHMNTLHGQERTRERQRLFSLGRQRMMAQEKREAAQRMRLLGLQANWEPVSAFCDGCEMPASTVFPEVAASGELLRGFRGNEEMATVWNTRHFQFPNTTAFSVTGICVTTPNRLVFLRQVLFYWTDPLVIIVYAPLEQQEELLRFVATHHLPRRLTLLLFLHTGRTDFPVNLLRNTAIRNVATTHFLVLDMDLWPCRAAAKELRRIPASVLRGRSAVILPGFFFDRKALLKHCSSVETCALIAMDFMPRNKRELVACVIAGHCYSSKNGMRTHVGVGGGCHADVRDAGVVSGAARGGGVARGVLRHRLPGTLRAAAVRRGDAAVRRAVHQLRVQQGAAHRTPACGGVPLLHPEPRLRDGPAAPRLALPQELPVISRRGVAETAACVPQLPTDAQHQVCQRHVV